MRFAEPKSGIWLAVYATAMAAAAACGGGDDLVTSPTGAPTEAENTPAITSSPSPTTIATFSPAVPASPAPTASLSGAPVPPPEAASAPIDLSRSNNSGDFPPLTDPASLPAAEATWLDGDDLVLGAILNGDSRAYSLSMMTLHHVVNDTIGGQPYLVTF